MILSREGRKGGEEKLEDGKILFGTQELRNFGRCFFIPAFLSSKLKRR